MILNGINLPNKDGKLPLIIAASILAIFITVAGLLSSCSKDAGNVEEKKNVTKAEAERAKKKGSELYRQGKWDKALEEFKVAVEGNPNDLYSQFQLAYSYEQKGQLDNAFNQYKEILKIKKESADAHYSMGRILVQKKELDKAITEFETAAKMDSDFTSVRVDLANAYTQKKDFEKALATYDELEKIMSNTGKPDTFYLSRLHVEKGKIYKQMGKTSEAKAEFTKALELNKDNKEAADELK